MPFLLSFLPIFTITHSELKFVHGRVAMSKKYADLADELKVQIKTLGGELGDRRDGKYKIFIILHILCQKSF